MKDISDEIQDLTDKIRKGDQAEQMGKYLIEMLNEIKEAIIERLVRAEPDKVNDLIEFKAQLKLIELIKQSISIQKLLKDESVPRWRKLMYGIPKKEE